MTKDMGASAKADRDTRESSQSSLSRPEASVPCAVRRTFKPFSKAPRDGTPFHICNTVRFNPFAMRMEVAIFGEDGAIKWSPVSFGNEPSYHCSLLPLSYELPSGFAFTLTYTVRRKTRWERLMDWMVATLPVYATVATMHRWLASGMSAGTAETPRAARGQGPASPTAEGGDAQEQSA